ncbi:DUF4279 domain-containing protein [Paraflavitalea sp. CAU 1676]|uniref:DUF4279 domain-containing protein n=1 Tax=Paraflavitalea sp. CAU 1676 TaxID=3032598 RepID=UPI0023DA8D4F|nr:DUF4279 domain-containing protein [Paraflavitalea sp. CAU 1676]MDF2193447.1 DUF4279 domain-containing protein [Paraflavitalea sp. CAU 1676]
MKDCKAKFGANLYVDTLDDSPEIITRITGVEYSEILIRGTQFYSPWSNKAIPNKKNERNFWIYRTPEIRDTKEWEFENGIASLLNVLNTQKEKFRELFSTYSNSYMLAYLSVHDFHVSFLLTDKIYSDLAYYGLNIKFDLYSLPEDADADSA